MEINLTQEQYDELQHIFENYAMTMDEHLALESVAKSDGLTQQFKSQKATAQKLWDDIEAQVLPY